MRPLIISHTKQQSHNVLQRLTIYSAFNSAINHSGNEMRCLTEFIYGCGYRVWSHCVWSVLPPPIALSPTTKIMLNTLNILAPFRYLYHAFKPDYKIPEFMCPLYRCLMVASFE